MSRKQKRRGRLHLAKRAISDLLEIEAYSIEQWGKRAATKYLKEIEVGLQLIREDPGILRPLEGLPAQLRFYRVNKHFLVCDAARESTVVLTVIHGSMDLPNRLGELVPQLATEVAMLRDQLDSSRRK